MTANPTTTIDGETLDDLLRIVTIHHPKADVDLIRLAYEYALEAHGAQERKSGAPYMTHPLATAITLARLGLDETIIAAGLLHDVPEDTDRSIGDIKKEFGKEIAFLVEGITKVGRLKYRGIDRYVENLRRMFVAMAEDARVVVIKFADRINNLRTLDALPPEKRRRIALESLEIYAPIANRLSMGDIKGQLEDLSFPYVYPEEYHWITTKVVPEFEKKKKVVEAFSENLQKELSHRGLENFVIQGRAKHLYSLYQKLIKNNRDLSRVYDLVAVRIIVESVAKCYETLGLVHEICKPLKGRIKDYIAQPKPNGYQSLHTTVFVPKTFAASDDGVSGEIVEVQIRTKEMHEEAEYGIAAHWKYKESKRSRREEQHRIDWMQQILDLQQDVSDTNELLRALKIDIFQNHIFVFTPRGDVIELPEDATPVDFAYQIHSDLGHKCSGAKVNEMIAPLDTTLKSGDVVEIYTDPHRRGPSTDWLLFVKTNTARHQIRGFLNKKDRRLLEDKEVDE